MEVRVNWTPPYHSEKATWRNFEWPELVPSALVQLTVIAVLREARRGLPVALSFGSRGSITESIEAALMSQASRALVTLLALWSAGGVS